MTGHAEAAEERAELAMHTLAPARSPDRRLPPLLHRLQSCSTRSSCELRSPQAVEADYPLADPAAPAATPVRDDDGFRQVLEPRDDDVAIASDLLRLIPGEPIDDGFPPSSFLSVSLCLSQEIRQDEVADAEPPDGFRPAQGQPVAGPKTWSQRDMESALDALRNHDMSLTKASAAFGIPSTTLWQRAHRLGIDTPKKEGPSKSWSEGNLHDALRALRTGTISANKASKAYGIPSSTLYKIARREGIRLAAPFNAAPTAWRPGDLERALQSIRSGHSSVQRASTEFGIPTGTLYGRCKREGIELSRSNPTPWSEDAMGEALEAVRVGQMSINQAAIHYNLPYSSLYGRFKRCKYENEAQARPPPDYRRQEAPDPSGRGCVPIS